MTSVTGGKVQPDSQVANNPSNVICLVLTNEGLAQTFPVCVVI